ncbi:37S ribosomal protein S25 [Drechslerella dactyloides]|uniref:37S ribosomal protein S25, mitochondrial n=1 Tax=Drechslerella dactyloides TaxID=74499 RepID=A0AAD6J4X7_DREDA|nr:37S ribosomal protein S25 [Drechslerella dactyloides]
MAVSRGARPLQVYKETGQLLRSGILKKEPPWYRVVASIPPSTILVRTAPVGFEKSGESRSVPKRARKSKRFFQPERIQYTEDELRQTFFADHPWELARPRILVEDSGNDGLGYDWSRLQQSGKALDGESVVQRQLWLMENNKLSKKAAYDVARREFYKLRMRSDIERRIAAEEARAVGAWFGKTHLQVGLELEEKALAAWKVKAEKALEKRQQRIDALAGPGGVSDDADEAVPAAGQDSPLPGAESQNSTETRSVAV